MPMATGSASALEARARLAPGRSGLLGDWVGRASQPVDAASFVVFRVAFGLLVAGSALRFVARGWVDEFYLTPAHHLTYADFDWVRPLPPALMYAHMAVLGLLGLAIAAGYKTRLAAGLFVLMFAYVELLDAALYLNHYWFVTLAALVVAIVPSPISGRVPRISVWALRTQIGVVYAFAGVAKLNADWLIRAQPMRLWLAARTDRPVIGSVLDEAVVAFAFSWAGAIFDLTIVAWLLWRRSRPIAYVVVVVFHVMTAMLFQIGVFPWVMILLTPIFFSAGWPRAVGKALGLAGASSRTTEAPGTSNKVDRLRPLTLLAVAALFVANLALPLRHYLAPGNVRFNDDGYYLSWRVMLTERAGSVEFDVTDPATGASWKVRPEDLLAEWQAAQVTRRPDLILTAAHVVADDAAANGHGNVSVRVDAWVAFNGRPRQRWIDPTVDLAALDRGAGASEYVLAIEAHDE